MENSDKKSRKAQAMIAFIVLCFCLMIPNYTQYQISPLGARVMEQYSLQLPQFSSLFSAPMIPAVLFSLAGGLLLDRFGTKRVIGAGLILTAAGCLWRVVCGSYTPLFLATMLTGFSACFINAGSGKIVGSLFETKEVPAKMGILMASSTAGMTIANLTSAYFPTIKSAFMASAAFSVIGAVLWFLFEKTPRETSSTKVTGEASMKECIRKAGKNGSVWLMSFALFFIMAANVVTSSFLPTALGTRGIDSVTSGFVAACYTAGNFLGCLLAPVCIAKLHSQKKVLVLFSVLAGIGTAFAWLIPMTALLAVAMLFTGTFLGGMIPTLMGLPVQLPEIGLPYAGTAGGVLGTVQVLGAVLVPTYILVPIAGDNFTILFILGGGCVILAGMLSGCLRKIK